jgi:hypothetical protein
VIVDADGTQSYNWAINVWTLSTAH